MPVESVADVALDQALARIGDLTERLWAVRGEHRPVRRRTPLGRTVERCAACGTPAPCATARAASGQRPA